MSWLPQRCPVCLEFHKEGQSRCIMEIPVEMPDMPVTRSIHQQFERSMTATVKASDFGWDAGIWATHFYVVGREGCFNLFSDIRRSGVLTAKVYRDAMGFEIIVDNQ